MAAETKKSPVVAKKSYKSGHIGIGFALKCSDWHGGSIKIEASADITCEQARALAKAIIEQADAADAKVRAKAAAEERRQKWRDREIAAGRMRVMSAGEFFR